MPSSGKDVGSMKEKKQEKYARFEESDAWKVSRELTNMVYVLTRKEGFRRDFGLVDQIRRAAVSVMNNIAEGHERDSNKEFIRFLFIARGSAGEVRSLLYVAMDQGYISKEEFEECSSLCVRAAQVIWGLIRFLRRSIGTNGSISIAGVIIVSVVAERILSLFR
jgi:four helix bundle protein